MSSDLLLSVALAYGVLLFAVAYLAEAAARRGRAGWLRSAPVYTLSLSIYCTAWTFYGSVGYATRSGLEFLTIYIGPTLVMVGWWWGVRKLVRIKRQQRLTSIADLISSRYGKSALLGGLVTLLGVIGTTPYIALQLQSVVLAFGVFTPPATGEGASAGWVALGLAAFAILFGTRNVDVDERHHGVVMAIALEALVKLVGLLAVGAFVVWGAGGGLGPVLERIETSPMAALPIQEGRWLVLILLSAAAFLTLPRMFHVLVVENEDERHLASAAWAFPLYLLLASIFVLPIAAVGLARMPEGANPDLFVLTLPLTEGHERLALLAFLGGFSSATSMVVVAAIALSTMMSNHIVLPLWLRLRPSAPGNLRLVLILARRLSIAAILGLGLGYYRWSGGGTALVTMGLVSFAGVAQLMPALIGGVFWRGATRIGAMLGLVLGFAIWTYTLLLPSLGQGAMLPADWLVDGPGGIGWLKPQALFGIAGLDPLVHSVVWSLSLNALAFLGGSLLSFPGPVERLQGALFVNAYDRTRPAMGWSRVTVGSEDLLVLAQRILGPAQAQQIFAREAQAQGRDGILPEPTPAMLDRLERRLAGSVGAATAHAMMARAARGESVSVADLMAVADEAAQIMEQSQAAQAQSEELARTARQLRDANDKLTKLSRQKDAFLGQISHELRTPMTSIRAFSEILMAEPPLPVAEQRRYAGIIHDEALRLTRLLDSLLDLSVLEHGQVQIAPETVRLRDVIGRALAAAGSAGRGRQLAIRRDLIDEDLLLVTDPDRLSQVFINVIANARKYCDARDPALRIRVSRRDAAIDVDFIDNGNGIAPQNQAVIFEKFCRLSDQAAAGSAGLGLAICKEIMEKLGGSISYLPGQGGAAFRVSLPVAPACAL